MMRGVETVAAAILCASTASLAPAGDVIYDSKGFEEFEGFIIDQGQDGWYPEGNNPLIWSGPPSRGVKSVQLRVFMADGGSSGMWRLTADLLALGYQRVTISFDVYRPTPEKDWYPDLTWGAAGQGNPVHGGQWNHNVPFTSRTYPFVDTNDPFTNDPWVDTIADEWATVDLTWDFAAGMAFGSYGGALVSEMEIENIDSFAHFGLTMEHGGAPDLEYEEYAWIDNFVITGEKGGCYPDCDASGGLDLFDFLCFVNQFDGGDDYADCDSNGLTDLFDFLCFVNAFNAGC